MIGYSCDYSECRRLLTIWHLASGGALWHGRGAMEAKHRKIRRAVAIALIVLGGVLWYLASETAGGLVVIALGLLVEIVGISLERRT